MNNTLDFGHYFIIAFVALIFITGCVVVFKFMRGGKK